MNQEDRFGHDPQVRHMRLVFAAMEQAGAGLLAAAGVSPFDPRLAAWRRSARTVFQNAAGRAGAPALGAEDLAALYARALAAVMARRGVDINQEQLPGPPELGRVIREVMP